MVCFCVTTQRASLQTLSNFFKYGASTLKVWCTYINFFKVWCIYIKSNVVVLFYFSFRILTFAVCSSVIRPVMKQACSSDDSFTSVHEPCNKHFTKCLMCAMLSTKWVTHGSGLIVRRGVRLCAAGAVQVRHTFTVSAHVRSRLEKLRHLACQVDMYVYMIMAFP